MHRDHRSVDGLLSQSMMQGAAGWPPQHHRGPFDIRCRRVKIRRETGPGICIYISTG